MHQDISQIIDALLTSIVNADPELTNDNLKPETRQYMANKLEEKIVKDFFDGWAMIRIRETRKKARKNSSGKNP